MTAFKMTVVLDLPIDESEATLAGLVGKLSDTHGLMKLRFAPGFDTEPVLIIEDPKRFYAMRRAIVEADTHPCSVDEHGDPGHCPMARAIGLLNKVD